MQQLQLVRPVVHSQQVQGHINILLDRSMQLSPIERDAIIGLSNIDIYIAPKIHRRRFSAAEKKYLEAAYKKNKYPNKYEYDVIINAVDSCYSTVYAWFARRRMKN